MSTIDLALLGALCNGPMSAYDLEKMVGTRHLARWIKMGSSTVYKKVASFKRKGYVTSSTTRDAKAPEKTLYTITQRGREAFDALMREFSESETRVFLDFNAVIVNLPLVSAKAAAEYIAGIRNSILATRSQIEAQMGMADKGSFLRDSLLRQQSMLLEALASWEAEFEQEFFTHAGGPAEAEGTK